MNKKILTFAAWIGLAAMLIWTGMSSSVFESRLLNFFYEFGTGIFAIALALFCFFAAIKFFPKSRGLSSLAILIFCIFVGALAKFALDSHLSAKAPPTNNQTMPGLK